MSQGTNLALLAGIFLPAAFAAILGYFMFYGRVSGVYVAIITLATTLILELLFSRTAGQQYTIGEAALGGYNGMTGIPSITLGSAPPRWRSRVSRCTTSWSSFSWCCTSACGTW